MWIVWISLKGTQSPLAEAARALLNANTENISKIYKYRFEKNKSVIR